MSNNIIRLFRALQSSRPVAALLGFDPWKTRFRAYARGPAPVSHVNQVKTAFGAAALLSAAAVIMAWNGVWWYFLFALLGSVLTLGLAWTMPSMEYKHLEALALERGRIYSGDRAPAVEGAPDQYRPSAQVIRAIFVHYGETARPIRCALADGSVRTFTREDTSRICVKSDLMASVRTEGGVDRVEFQLPNDVVLLLAALFGVEGPLDLDPFTEWSEERLQSAIDDASALHLIRKVHRGLLHKRLESIESTDAGEIVLAAEMRRRGLEIMEEAGPPVAEASERKRVMNQLRVLYSTASPYGDLRGDSTRRGSRAQCHSP